MRDKRAIIIKDSRLRKIRNNLRLLWLKAMSAKWNRLFDEMDRLSKNDDGSIKSVKYMTPEDKARFRALQEEQSQLRSMADRSICKCVACAKANRDMVYNKAYDAWYCIECYGKEHSIARRRVKVGQKGSKSCREEALEEHSKTFL